MLGDYMKLFLMGCIIGIGKVLPGISGSVLAIRLGIYEKVMDAIFNFRKDVKENISFLGVLGAGFLFATIFASKILLQLFLNYGFILKVLFILFIITGIPSLMKKSNSFKITLIAFFLTSSIFWFPKGNFPIKPVLSYFFMGLIESFSTIVPGISGTAIFLSLGWYQEVLRLFSELYLFPYNRLIPFAFGIAVGGYFLLKLMNYLFHYYSEFMYSAILGFLLSSLFFVF